MAPTFPRTELAPGLDICRLVVGLWQVGPRRDERR